MDITIRDVGYDRQNRHTAEPRTLEIPDGLVRAAQICAAAGQLTGKRICHAEPIQPGASTWNVYERVQGGTSMAKVTMIAE